MKTERKDREPNEKPTLEIVSNKHGGYFIGIIDEIGAWPFQSEVFDTREEAEKKLSELNAPLPYQALCPGCKEGYSEQEFLKLDVVSGLWACPCSQNSLLFPSSQTVEESVNAIQEFMTQRRS